MSLGQRANRVIEDRTGGGRAESRNLDHEAEQSRSWQWLLIACISYRQPLAYSGGVTFLWMVLWV